jgi:general secretion pathway protein G
MSRSRRSALGFTLIELIIVIFMMSILMAISIPKYVTVVRHAREVALKEDLSVLRKKISEYTQDKRCAPQSLDDLVTAGYLGEVPIDPITQSNATWRLEFEDVLEEVDQNCSGITNVRSGAIGETLDGKPYSQL